MEDATVLFNLWFEPHFYSAHEVGWRDVQRRAKFEKHSDAGTVFSQFQQADIVALNASIQCKCFLRKLALPPHCAQYITKCLFWIQASCPISYARGSQNTGVSSSQYIGQNVIQSVCNKTPGV